MVAGGDERWRQREEGRAGVVVVQGVDGLHGVQVGGEEGGRRDGAVEGEDGVEFGLEEGEDVGVGCSH